MGGLSMIELFNKKKPKKRYDWSDNWLRERVQVNYDFKKIMVPTQFIAIVAQPQWLFIILVGWFGWAGLVGPFWAEESYSGMGLDRSGQPFTNLP